ncbi:MAG: DUF928 domain-containing protein [Cyanobacteria bacterium J06592_8]
MVWTSAPQTNIIATFSLALSLEIVTSSFMLPAQARSHPISFDRVTQNQSTNNGSTTQQADNSQSSQTQSSQTEISQAAWDDFTPPSEGIPGRREGAGTRGRCPGGLTALIPSSTLGRTASEKPTIYYYLPASLDKVWVKFELLDEQDQPLYETSFEMKEPKSGIIGLNLSELEDAPALEADKTYHWFLTIRCEPDPFDPSGNIVVDGWINRVALNSTQLEELDQAEPLERLKFYTKEALWYESVETLVQLRLSNPEESSFEERWVELLTSVGLGDIAPKPLISSEFFTSASEEL